MKLTFKACDETKYSNQTYILHFNSWRSFFLGIATYTGKGTMGICETFKSDRKFYIAGTNYVLNLEILPTTTTKWNCLVTSMQMCIQPSLLKITLGTYLEFGRKPKLLDNSCILEEKKFKSDWGNTLLCSYVDHLIDTQGYAIVIAFIYYNHNTYQLSVIKSKN